MNTHDCGWVADEDGVFETSCGEEFVFIDGGPEENRMNFCPYCGGVLISVPYMGEEYDDD